MNMSTEMLEQLNNNPDIRKELKDYIVHDAHICYCRVADCILQNELTLPANWSKYSWDDIDIYHTDDAIKIHEYCELFGITDYMDRIHIGDQALFLIYEFNYNDMLGNAMYNSKMIHVLHVKAGEELKEAYIFRAE